VFLDQAAVLQKHAVGISGADFFHSCEHVPVWRFELISGTGECRESRWRPLKEVGGEHGMQFSPETDMIPVRPSREGRAPQNLQSEATSRGCGHGDAELGSAALGDIQIVNT
jgi:hypothetical protein